MECRVRVTARQRVVLKPGDRVRPAVVAEEDAALAVARPRLSRKGRRPVNRSSAPETGDRAAGSGTGFRLEPVALGRTHTRAFPHPFVAAFNIPAVERNGGAELSRPMAPATARSSTCRTGIARS